MREPFDGLEGKKKMTNRLQPDGRKAKNGPYILEKEAKREANAPGGLKESPYRKKKGGGACEQREGAAPVFLNRAFGGGGNRTKYLE